MPVNDRGMGRGAKIASGTVRDSLHMIDVIFGLDGGELPKIVVTNTGSYSEVVFGLLELLGSYRPAPADLTDKKGWRNPGRRRLRQAEHLRPLAPGVISDLRNPNVVCEDDD